MHRNYTYIYTCILVYLHKIRILNSSKGQIVGKITYFTQLSINSNLISIFCKVVMYTIMHYFLHQSWQNYYRYIPTILPNIFPHYLKNIPAHALQKINEIPNFYSLSFNSSCAASKNENKNTKFSWFSFSSV